MMENAQSAESDGSLDRVQMFSEGDFVAGTLTWGWQCFLCRDEETGFGSATTAGEGRDNHAALCPRISTGSTEASS